jgi:hypothetical protein
MTIRLVAAKSFKRDLKKIRDKRRRDSAQEALLAFRENPKSRGLNFESIRGKPEYYTIRSNYHDRVLLRQVSRSEYEVVAVGNHDYIYDSFRGK